jgi:uncharacterized membrane protein
MTNHPEKLQQKVDAYLMELRRCLGELPAEEVNDILREIRSHILEKAEASGGLSEERLVGILKALGRPEDIAPLYQADSIMTRARASFSPAVVLRGMLRWAMISARGFAIFMAGLIGYGLGVGFVLAAIGKIFAPAEVGAWLSPGGFSIGTNSNPAAREVLGYWLIPVGLTLGSFLVVATTRVLRWSLHFARVRRPTGS